MSSNQTTHDQTANKTHLMVELLYDGLMKQIEPELVTDRIEYLDFQYAGETPDERKKRMERYAKAMVTFEDRLATLMGAWEREVKTFRDGLLANIQRKTDADDVGTLTSLDEQIGNS
jgi:hypothetical protein